jgi:hypothetical protein
MHPPGPGKGEARDLAGCSRLSEKPNSYDADKIADATREGKRQRRIVPHDADAERDVIGFMVLRPVAFPIYGPSLTTRDFFCPGLRTIFGTLTDIHAEGAALTLDTVARRLEPYDIGTLGEAIACCPMDTPGFYTAWVRLRVMRSARRKLGMENFV